jgi:hypothetical protein
VGFEVKMKKTLLIMILISLVLVAAFAIEVEPAHRVVLHGLVSDIENFKMKLEAALDGSSFSGDDISSGIDLTKDGTVSFKIIDLSEINLKDEAVIELAVRDTSFKNTVNAEAVVETQIHSYSNTEDTTDNVIVSWVSADKVWAITYPSATYISREGSGVTVGMFLISWSGNAFLGAGTYTDTVELIYSAK